jgi:chromate transporter
MIPVIQQEMERLGWLNTEQFLDILGIAQMTPGAISVNTATFAGYRVINESSGSFWLACLGALAGTLSVCSPSLLCINATGKVLKKYRNHQCMIMVFSILRPLVSGLIVTAALSLVFNSVCGDVALREALHSVNWFALSVALCAFLLTVCTRVTPVLVLLAGVIAGVTYGLI